jgi:hypothetical protein
LWSLVPVGLLFLSGLLRANYEELQKVGREKDALKAKIGTEAKRTALKDLLGSAHERGGVVNEYREGDDADRRQRRIEEWVWGTHKLIEAAFDKGEAQRFLSNEGYDFGRINGVQEFIARRSTFLVGPRLWRLEELIGRVDTLSIRSDFDPEAFAQQFRESAAEQVDLEVVLKQKETQIERLEEDKEQLTDERDARELESRKYKAELDGQIRGRCFEVARDLFAFYREVKGQDPDDAMRQYKQRLRDRVDPLRSDLMRYEKWSPKEEAREQLEYPTHPDHLLRLADYSNASCGHGFW